MVPLRPSAQDAQITELARAASALSIGHTNASADRSKQPQGRRPFRTHLFNARVGLPTVSLDWLALY